MSLINEIKKKIKQEGSLSVYLKEYFWITDWVIFETVLSYIDYLLKVDNKFEESIKLYLKEENSKFLLDKLLNLKLLPQSFLDKNYLEKVWLKKWKLEHKWFLNISDRFLDNNFVNGFFNSIDNLNSFKEKLKVKLVEQFENDFLSQEKIEKAKEFVKYNFLKNAWLLDETEDVKNEILQREKLKLERDYREYILEHYQIDIKDQILDKLWYIKYEDKIEKEEEMLIFLKKFFQEEFDFSSFQDIYLNIQNSQLRNLLIYYFVSILYISIHKYIIKIYINNLDKKEDKELIKKLEKEYLQKNDIIKKFNWFISGLEENEFYLQEVNYSNFYSCYLWDILQYDKKEITKEGFFLKGIVWLYNQNNIIDRKWNELSFNDKQEILDNLQDKSSMFLISDKQMYKKINQFIQQYQINEDVKSYKSQQDIIKTNINSIFKNLLDMDKSVKLELDKIKDFSNLYIAKEEVNVEMENNVSEVNDGNKKWKNKKPFKKLELNKYVPKQIIFIMNLANNYILAKQEIWGFYVEELQYNIILKDKLLKDIQFFSNNSILFLEDDNEVIKILDEFFVGKELNLDELLIKADWDDKVYKNFYKGIRRNKDLKNEFINKFGKEYEKFIKNVLLYKKYDKIIELRKLKENEKKTKTKNKIKLSLIDKELLELLETKLKENEQILWLWYFMMQNIWLYEYKVNYLLDTVLDYFKIDKFMYAFFLNTYKLSYIDNFYVFLLKIIFYNLSDNVFSLKLISHSNLRKIFTSNLKKTLWIDNTEILSENLFFLYNQVAEFLYKYFFLYIEYKKWEIDYEKYKTKVIEIQKEVHSYSEEVKKYIEMSIKYLLAYFEKDIKSDDNDNLYILFMNSIIEEFEKYKDNWFDISELLSHLLTFVDIKEQEIDDNIKNVSTLLSNIDILEKVDVFKLLHLLITEDVTITKSDEFFVVWFEEYAFVILQKQEMWILNSAILTLESDFKNKEHVFVWTNSEVFSFLYQKILLKLNLVWVSVTTRDLLSWLYYNNEISDLDIYGTSTTSSSRIKVRTNGTYQLLKRYDGNQEKMLFSFSDLENFINDLFMLWGTIWDQSVEDTAIKIWWVKFRIGIMKDWDNLSLSARKISSTAHKFSIYKWDQLLQVLRDNFGFEPIVNKLYYEKDQVTLDMSYSKEDVKVLLDRATSDRWVFMIIWKTRSGKSTSLRNFLDYLFETWLEKWEVKKIVTLEDPIEFSNPNWNQIEVPAEAGALEDAVNKWLKRQDPDIVVVWETRSASTLPWVLTVANNSATFTTMHITNPIDWLFTLKDFAKANGNTLMDVVNVLNVIVSQKLVNKIHKEKVAKVMKKVGIDYDRLKIEWITLFKNRVEIESYLEQLWVLWLVPVTREPYHVLMDKYNKWELDKEKLEYVEGYLYYCKKTFDLFNEQWYLIKEVHKKYTRPQLYYDYVDRWFIDANMELILRMDDKNSPIKELKQRFVDTFSLKEEKALQDYFIGELPYFDGLNILDVAYYIYILKKLYILNKETDG